MYWILFSQTCLAGKRSYWLIQWKMVCHFHIWWIPSTLSNIYKLYAKWGNKSYKVKWTTKALLQVLKNISRYSEIRSNGLKNWGTFDFCRKFGGVPSSSRPAVLYFCLSDLEWINLFIFINKNYVCLSKIWWGWYCNRYMYELRWQDLGIFWPPNPLRWHFLWHNRWQKVDIFGPPT